MYNAHRFFSEMAIVQNLLYTADSTICCTTVYRATGYTVTGCPALRVYLADWDCFFSIIGATGRPALCVYGADWALFLYL